MINPVDRSMLDRALAGKPWRRLSPRSDERRALWFLIVGTFIGGLTSIIVGAAVLGIALALARHTKEVHLSDPQLAVAAIVAAASLTVGIIGTRGYREDRTMLVLSVLIVVLGTLATALFLLAFIGDAAGIK